MPTVRGSWLTRGYFVLRNDGLMREVRDILERSLGQPKGTLSIRMAPEEPGQWKHICWWRAEHAPYREAQFFVQISRDYPILSLGISIEKGFETDDSSMPRGKRMDGRWDWHTFITTSGRIVGSDVGDLARKLKRPITLRSKRKTQTDEAWTTDSFSFVSGNWYNRHEGHFDQDRIVKHLNQVNRERDQWAIVHLACDLSPDDADGLTATDIAAKLLLFNRIRNRLRAPTTKNQ
jgi:hypothetical protein